MMKEYTFKVLVDEEVVCPMDFIIERLSKGMEEEVSVPLKKGTYTFLDKEFSYDGKNYGVVLTCKK